MLPANTSNWPICSTGAAVSIYTVDVLDAQRRYFDAQIGLSNAVRDEHLALVQLYKALGGGWELEEE